MRRATVSVVALVVLAGCAGGLTSDAPETTTPTPAATATTPASGADGTLEVHFINVGQSTSILVVSPGGETMLVDSGDYTDDGEYVLSYLRERDVERIDYLVTSHADADHVGGHAAVIEYFETEAAGVGAVYDPGIAASTGVYEAYLDAVERFDVPLYRTAAGDRIPLAGTTVRVLSPPEEYLANRDRNENSVVLRVAHGEASVLLTGDAEAEGESFLVGQYGPALNATVLSAGHHGSSDSSGAPLLDAVDPRTVVVSSAYDSRYGHPHEELLERLAARNLTTYWSATHGDVVAVTDGRRVSIRTQAAAPTAPSDLRTGAAVPPGSSTPATVRETYCVAADCDADASVTSTAAAPTARLELVEVRADPPGNDNERLNKEYLVFRNGGAEPLSLGGWVVSDAAGHDYRFPEAFALAPGATVTLHTGSGTGNETDRYWGSETAVWNNDGDTVTVRAASGETVLREGYA